ncbi:MAG: DUF6370 family protein [Flavobacteriales bacterium]|nr:DUF6370 family protein [Flavobacteriales bacterium]
MKKFNFAMAVAMLPLSGFGQVAGSLAQTPDANKPLLNVEATCGECNFHMEGDGCDLAVRLPQGAYYVDGVGISEYGHPHNEHGFCVAMRRAEVQGEVVDGRFKASYFKLLPPEAKKSKIVIRGEDVSPDTSAPAK